MMPRSTARSASCRNSCAASWAWRRNSRMSSRTPSRCRRRRDAGEKPHDESTGIKDLIPMPVFTRQNASVNLFLKN
ncbi:hypothetical protein CCGE531_03410 [Rhizobium sp. CCGE531]|nr:hypothetical protein CCGE531_03410 [Rhizobium sp. CCGE531]AYG71622.1 hypothetical protein CCGE532_03400 [Rhizobium sp. CCGE532]